MDELYAMSGYVFTLGGVAVSWRSCKQTIIMRLSRNVIDAASKEMGLRPT
jgi:uncharacterized membrane protein